MRRMLPKPITALISAPSSPSNPMSGRGLFQAGERHLSAFVEGVEESLKLSLIRMIGNITGIEQLHRKLAPFGLVQTAQSCGMEFIVEQRSFAPDEVNVKVVRLQTIDH